VDRELYAGVIVSNSYKVKGPVFIFSSEGGSSIEEVAERNPERISQLNVDYLKGVSQENAIRLISDVSFNSAGLSQDLSQKLAEIICGVYTAFRQYDARNIEVNPLIITKENQIIAADCHVTIDDNSVFRHPELGIELPRDMERPPTELEKKAWTIEEGDYRGTGYFAQMVPKIEGEGWLGFHGIGGGGAMLGASAFVARGLKIANYADTSGDPPASKIYKVIKCILSQPIDGYVLMGACLANQEQWHHAHALVKAFREEAKKRSGFPVLMLIGGNKEKETHQIIKEGFKDLPLRWELYGREYIYDTDFIADRVEALVKDYQKEK
jgi:succinyl-CoA synthetase beta subunit